MFGTKKSNPVTGKIETLIGREALFVGDLEFVGGLHIEGNIRGAVRARVGAAAAPATLWIGEHGRIEGEVAVTNIVIDGEVCGDVHAAARVVLGAKARITGNIYYGSIEMTLGARVDGKMHPAGREPTTSAVVTATPTPSVLERDSFDAREPQG